MREIIEEILKDHHLARFIGGRTPHKTVQARLATDIRINGPRSAFYRYAPATFGLRQLADEGAYDRVYRKIFVGRDRRREVDQTPVLCFNKPDVKLRLQNKMLPAEVVPMRFWRKLPKRFVERRLIDDHLVIQLQLFIVVRFEDQVICYEPTDFDDRNREISRLTSIGLSGSVYESDIDMFDVSGIGFDNANVREIKSFFYFLDTEVEKEIRAIDYIGVVSDHISPERNNKLGIVAQVEVDQKFALSNTILGISNLHWRSLRYIPNCFSELDSWSQYTFRFLHERVCEQNL